MARYLFTILFIATAFSWTACSSSRFVSPQKAETQSSVKLTMKDGSQREGIVFKGNKEQLLFVNVATHKMDSVKYSLIRSVVHLNKYFDFAGFEMPNAEISNHQGVTKTLLYGTGGLILGAAAGTGAAIALFKPKSGSDPGNSNAAIATIVGAGALGAAIFGWKGRRADFETAVFTARKARYAKVHAELEKKKQELEKLKREQKTLQ